MATGVLVLFLFSSFCMFASLVHGLDNAVGLTPAMGYNTWNDFRCNGISAANVMKVADAIIGYGLDKLGYEYVNIDDCWAVSRDANGVLVPDPDAFPQGILPLAEYIHSKGLKFGMYTDRGNTTCAGRPASGGHEVIDAQTFANWTVDYIKEDSCDATQVHELAFEEYGRMRDALNATGRHIYFSLCGWNSWYAPAPGYSLGNSWRIAGDCNEWPSVYNAIMVNTVLYPYGGPGGWNDPDMLVGSSPNAAVHNTPAQARTQFSLWSIMAAPLLIGSNILNLSNWDLETYSNAEVIALDQDPLGKQGTPVHNTCPQYTAEDIDEKGRLLAPDALVPPCEQIWVKYLSDGSYGVIFVNFDVLPRSITCDEICFARMNLVRASVRDLWAHQDLGVFSTYSASVGGDGDSATFKFTPAP